MGNKGWFQNPLTWHQDTHEISGIETSIRSRIWGTTPYLCTSHFTSHITPHNSHSRLADCWLDTRSHHFRLLNVLHESLSLATSPSVNKKKLIMTIKYRSTRGKQNGLRFEEVILGGLATDRGLYVPESIPTFTIDEIEKVIDCSARCAWVFKIANLSFLLWLLQ